MTEQQARKLKVGNTVTWNENPQDTGNVIDVSNATFTVKWNADRYAGYSIILFERDQRLKQINETQHVEHV